MNNIENALEFLRQSGKSYAQAKSDRVYLENFRKTKKALLKIEARLKGIKSDCECEDYAYAHPEYLEVLEGLKVATEKEAFLKHEIDRANLKFDKWRTEESTKRSELNAYK